MDTQSLSKHPKPGITTEACSIELICGIHDVSKRITQLKKTGDNFNAWERDLKVMIGSITGSYNYFVRELDKHDPKFNRAVFNLIYWSIDEELRQELIIDGSAGDAFQFLAGRFRSDPLNQCIMSRATFPEEILDNIVNFVYHQSFQEHDSIKQRKRERMVQVPIARVEDYTYIYRDHRGSPILSTFQTLAVVNRRFHRLCLPKMWQKITFPSALPAPVSIWTHDILLKRGNLVRYLEFELDDVTVYADDEASEISKSVDDNTSLGSRCDLEDESRYGIGLVNIRNIFKACPYLESVTIHIPEDSYYAESSSPIASRLKDLFGLIPQLRRLVIKNPDGGGGLTGEFVIDSLTNLPSLVTLELFSFAFEEKSSPEKSFGWNLAQHRNLRELRLREVDCNDQTWTLKSWPQRLTTLELYCCGLTSGMVQKMLSGCAPFLARLEISLDRTPHGSGVWDQTDLPALQHLLCHRTSLEFLVCFQSCKNIEAISYHGPINDYQWYLVKHLLSTCTWPKILVLDLRVWYSAERINDNNWRTLTEKDVDDIWQSFKIKLLIK